MLPVPMELPLMLSAMLLGGDSVMSTLYQVSGLHSIVPPLQFTRLRGASVLGMKQNCEGPPADPGGFKPKILFPSPQKKIFEYTALWFFALKVKDIFVSAGTLTFFM